MEVLKEFREGTFKVSSEDAVIDSKVDKLELPEKPDRAPQTQVPHQASQRDSSVYAMACQSLMSNDVERWMEGSVTPTHAAAVRGSKPSATQRSALVTETTPASELSLYILALVMPLLNLANPNHWRRTHKAVLNALELSVARMRRTCSRVRCHIMHAVHSQLTREIFATAIDVVLVVYAIGFLFLSIYQAAIYVY